MDKIIMILTILVAIAYRYGLENKMYAKRNNAMLWGFFAGTVIFSIIPLFINDWIISLSVAAVPVLFMFITYIVLGMKNMQKIKNIIITNGVVFDKRKDIEPVVLCDILLSDETIDKINPDKKEIKNYSVKHKISHERKGGKFIPIFTHLFTIRMAENANNECYDRTVKELAEAFPEYIWTWYRSSNNAIFVAYVGDTNENVKSSDIKDVEKVLPWYVLPFAVKDSALHITKDNTSYFLKLHNTPKYEEATTDLTIVRNKKKVQQEKLPKLTSDLNYTNMLKTEELGSNDYIRNIKNCSMLLVAGNNNQNKMSIVHQLLGHFVAKKSDVYMINGSEDFFEDFSKFKPIPNVKSIACDLSGSYEIIKKLLYEATQRYNALMKMEIKRLPLNGVLHIERRVAVNGNILGANDRIHIRIAGDEKDILAQDIQPGMECVMAGSKIFRIPNHWEVAFQENIQHGGDFNFPPIILFCNDWFDITNIGENAVLDDDLEGIDKTNVPNAVMANEILTALNTLAHFGKQINMHIIFMNNEVDDNILPVSFRDAIDMRILVGEANDETKKIVKGSDNIESINLNYDNKIYINLVNYDREDILKIIDCDVASALETCGVSKKEINKIVSTNNKNKKKTEPVKKEKVEKPKKEKVSKKKDDKKSSKPAKSKNDKKNNDKKKQKQNESVASAIEMVVPAREEKVIKVPFIMGEHDKRLKPLLFEPYMSKLPEEMPEGVIASYGLMGERKEASKVKGKELDVGAGRKIILNDTNRFKEKHIDLSTSLSSEDSEERAMGTNMLPEITDFIKPQEQENDVQSLEDYVQGKAEMGLAEDDGRVDEVEDGVVIVGDSTSLNSVYSEIIDDEGDDFHIVK